MSIIVFALSSKLDRIYSAVPAETTIGRPVDTKTAPGHVGMGFARVSLETRQDNMEFQLESYVVRVERQG